MPETVLRHLRKTTRTITAILVLFGLQAEQTCEMFRKNQNRIRNRPVRTIEYLINIARRRSPARLAPMHSGTNVPNRKLH